MAIVPRWLHDPCDDPRAMRGCQRLFCYGTLMFPRVMIRVTGRCFQARAARLPDHAVLCLWGEAYPGLWPRPGAVAEGMLYEGLGTAHLRRLDHYEGRLYCRRRVVLADGTPAWTYMVSARGRRRLSAVPWDGARLARRGLQACTTLLRVRGRGAGPAA